MRNRDEDINGEEIIVRSLKQPSCVSAKEESKSIIIDIEKELGIEIVGDTKVKVQVEEEEEPWDIIDENDYNENVSNEIDKEVNDKYIGNKMNKEQ